MDFVYVLLITGYYCIRRLGSCNKRLYLSLRLRLQSVLRFRLQLRPTKVGDETGELIGEWNKVRDETGELIAECFSNYVSDYVSGFVSGLVDQSWRRNRRHNLRLRFL